MIMFWIPGAMAAPFGCTETLSASVVQDRIQRWVLEAVAPVPTSPWRCVDEPLDPQVVRAIFVGLAQGGPTPGEQLEYLKAATPASDHTMVTAPEGLVLWVNGEAAPGRPMDRPALIQVLADGAPTYTAVIDPITPLPTGFEEVWPQQPEPLATPEGPEPGVDLVMREIAQALGDGDAQRVNELVVRAWPIYPDRAPSFRAAMLLAAHPAGAVPPKAFRVEEAPTETATPAPRGPRPASPIRLGFEAGFPSGVRVEVNARPFDLGVRLAQTWFPGNQTLGNQVDGYLNWHLPEADSLQIETVLGFMGDEIPLLHVGAAFQYDPPDSPLLATVGLTYFEEGIQPLCSMGMMW